MIIKKILGMQNNTTGEIIDSTLDTIMLGNEAKPGIGQLIKDYTSYEDLIIDISELKKEKHYFDNTEKKWVSDINEHVKNTIEQSKNQYALQTLKTKYQKLLTLALDKVFITVKKLVKTQYYQELENNEKTEVAPNMKDIQELYKTITGKYY